ncbi:MAG: type II toxin-antitoxin system VapC family toxin [Deltaproteobacteria bacterium]|nr:type II toxin-antitoxin system VapC family toxin [Deltaproteobacteria bacterium]
MNGVKGLKAVFDTNILVDYLRGISPAEQELQTHTEPSISIITWMEVLVGAKNEAETGLLKKFLSSFELLPLSHEIAEEAVLLRRKYQIRIPDAIIWATARCYGSLLVTRNTRDFPHDSPEIRVPYYL